MAECPVLSDALLIGVFADGHDSNLYFALLHEDVPWGSSNGSPAKGMETFAWMDVATEAAALPPDPLSFGDYMS